jgi:hypothetical protein
MNFGDLQVSFYALQNLVMLVLQGMDTISINWQTSTRSVTAQERTTVARNGGLHTRNNQVYEPLLMSIFSSLKQYVFCTICSSWVESLTRSPSYDTNCILSL